MSSPPSSPHPGEYPTDEDIALARMQAAVAVGVAPAQAVRMLPGDLDVVIAAGEGLPPGS